MPGVVTYEWPAAVAGGTTPPGHTQVANMVNARVVFTDLDTVATITHNMQASGLANGFPVVTARLSGAPSTTLAAPYTIVDTDSNTVTVGKVAQTGSAMTIEVCIQRTHSIIK